MSVIVFTVCTVSHLGQAKALCDSVLQYNPGYKCIIGLADRMDGRVDTEELSPHSIIEAKDIGVRDLDGMCTRYDALELSCALKSYFGNFILDTYAPRKIIFLDSDILAFHSFESLESDLDNYSILLTPHITTPFPVDACRPSEKEILKTGIYNAGFTAYRNDDHARSFLKWWMERMVDQSLEAPKEGLYVDQKWLNLVPLYFKGVKVLDHPGCNAAYWNIHERSFEKRNGQYFVNHQWPLLFFHFSGYSMDQPEEISRHQNRFSLKEYPVIKELLSIYHAALEKNRHREFLKFRNVYLKKGWREWLKS